MRGAKIVHLHEGTSQVQRLESARATLLPCRIEKPVATRLVVGPSALERPRASIAHQADVRRPPSFPAER